VATSPALTAAYDELIGPGRWTPPDLTGGTLVARFPSDAAASDAGWHIEGNWSNGTEYCTNVHSDGHGLFALFLFSDVILDALHAPFTSDARQRRGTYPGQVQGAGQREKRPCLGRG
jgi:hypothetical protein